MTIYYFTAIIHPLLIITETEVNLSYRKILEDAGTPPEMPTKEFKYLAYKDGKCQEFESRADADRFSKLVEKVQKNTDKYKTLMDEYESFYSKVFNDWYSEVREYFDELNQAQFNRLYSQAYDDSHSGGYDEVFGTMEELASFYSDMCQASDQSFAVRQH